MSEKTTPKAKAFHKRDEALAALADAGTKLETALADWPSVPGRLYAETVLETIDDYLEKTND